MASQNSESLPSAESAAGSSASVTPGALGHSPEQAELDQLQNDLLQQTADVVQQVRRQLADLDRRERKLAEQLGLLDNERRAFRMEQQQFENQTREDRAEIEERRQQAAIESDRLRAERAELASSREQLVDERRQLKSEQEQLHEKLALDSARERDQLEAAFAEVAEERDSVRSERRRLEEESSRLQSEFDERQAQLECDHAAFREQQEAETARQREALENSVDEAALSDELKRERELLEQEQRRFQQRVDDWYSEVSEQEQQLRRRRHEIDAANESAERELHQLRLQQWEVLEQERLEHERSLAAAQEEAANDLEQSRIASRKQTALEESRVRFQTDHLERTRDEIAQAKEQLRVDYQSLRQQLYQTASCQQLRDRQLERRRLVLEQRETALTRQIETVARLKQAQQAEAQREKESLAAEQATWELRQQAQTAENRRQIDLLSSHGEVLETRRARLDEMRAELEQRHGALVDVQTALDTLLAEFDDQIESVSIHERLEDLKNQTPPILEKVRADHASMERHLGQLTAQQQEQQQALQTARNDLREMIALHTDKLTRAESTYAEHRAELLKLEQEMHRSTLAWQQLRREDEQVLLDLLDQLRSQVDAPPEYGPAGNLLDSFAVDGIADAA